MSLQLDGRATISDVRQPTANGFSADTFMIRVDIEVPVGPGRHEHLVVQAAPDGPALFADYDLARTFRVQRALAPFDVPVAAVRWLCDDTSWIGAPFYVMDFVEGRVPPDRPPYHVDGWMSDAPAEERATIWHAGIDALAALHEVPVDGFSFLGEGDQHDPAHQRFDRWRQFGAELGADAEPDLLAALDQLDGLRPEPGELRVHWGDAKLGNMIFDHGRAAAILDWELCGLSAAEEDLAHWLAVDWFLSTGIGNPRLSGLPGPAETVARYESTTGRSTDGVQWWFVFALVRMGLIFQRAAVQSRLRRGADGPLRPNSIVPHLRQLLDGETWERYRASGT